MAYTGNTATLTLSTTAVIGRINSMTWPEITMGSIDDSDLSTTVNMESIPEDLADPGEFTATLVVDDPTEIPQVLGVVETATITLPLLSGESTAGKITGTGFLTSAGGGSIENNTRFESSITFKFDGKTGPTATAGSA